MPFCAETAQKQTISHSFNYLFPEIKKISSENVKTVDKSLALCYTVRTAERLCRAACAYAGSRSAVRRPDGSPASDHAKIGGWIVMADNESKNEKDTDVEAAAPDCTVRAESLCVNEESTVHPPERSPAHEPDMNKDESDNQASFDTEDEDESKDDAEIVDPEAQAAAEEIRKEVDEDLPTESEQHEQVIENVFECLIDLLDNRHYVDFRNALEDLQPVEVADFFTELPAARIPTVFKLLTKDQAADVFAELDVDEQERIISAMTDREITAILEDLALDDAVDMLQELPASIVRRVMKNATPETRSDINRLLAYPEDSAGSVMTAEFIDLRRSMTCAQAVDHIRKTGVDKETVYVAYVTNESRVLQGIVPLKALLFAGEDELIEDIMDENIICASTLDDQETVASIISKYDMLALPIVDREHRLVGIVTVDDAMDVMENEVTEDIEIMAAIVPSDKPYLKTSVFETWKKRIPWLLLLMVSATFTSTILGHFEDALSKMAILTVFIPMLMDTGGNAGGQTSVTIIRGLSIGEIELSDIGHILWKEFRVSILCGLTVGCVCFVKTMLVDFRLAFTADNIRTSLVVCLTICLAIMIAKMIGSLLPVGAKKLGFDPAVMASPFITTIVDTMTLLLYFAIAKTFLPL